MIPGYKGGWEALILHDSRYKGGWEALYHPGYTLGV